MPIDRKILMNVTDALPAGNHPITGKVLQRSVGEGRDEQGPYISIKITDPELIENEDEIVSASAGIRYKIIKLGGEIVAQ